MSSVRQTSLLLPLFLTTTTHHLWLSLFFFSDKTLRIIAVEIAVHLLLPFYSLHLDQSLSTNLGHLPAYYVWGGFTKIHDCSRHQRCVSLFILDYPLVIFKNAITAHYDIHLTTRSFFAFDIHKSHPSSFHFKIIGVYQLNLQTTSP